MLFIYSTVLKLIIQFSLNWEQNVKKKIFLYLKSKKKLYHKFKMMLYLLGVLSCLMLYVLLFEEFSTSNI